MILDDIKHATYYHSIGPLFKKAFEFIAVTDLKNLSLGKHEIQGEKLFVIVMEYETKDPQDCIMENHKKYCDIQCMLHGEEFIGVKTFSGQKPTIRMTIPKTQRSISPILIRL